MAKRKLQRIKTDYPGVFYYKSVAKDTGKTERIYYISYYKNGKQVEEKAGRQFKDDMTAAKANAIRIRRIEGRELPNTEQRKFAKEDKITVDRVYNLYMEYHKNKSLKTTTSYYENHIKSVFGHKTFEEITSIEIMEFRAELEKKSLQPATVRNTLEILKRLSNFAFNNQVCKPLQFNIKMPSVDNEKTEQLTKEQMKSLIKVLNDEFNNYPDEVTIMRLALFLGLRHGEVIKMKWEHIDFENKVIRLPDTKAGKNQIVHLNQKAIDAIKQVPKHLNSEFVVYPEKPEDKRKPQNTNNRILKSFIKKAGIEDFRQVHGLRHAFASMLYQETGDVYLVSKMLRHANVKVSQRYTHLHDTQLKNTSSKIDDIINKSINL